MLSFGNSYSRDSKRWLQCRQAAASAMIADGWNKHARKFDQVVSRRASKLYRQGPTA